jgi:hypothetical protein
LNSTDAGSACVRRAKNVCVFGGRRSIWRIENNAFAANADNLGNSISKACRLVLKTSRRSLQFVGTRCYRLPFVRAQLARD